MAASGGPFAEFERTNSAVAAKLGAAVAESVAQRLFRLVDEDELGNKASRAAFDAVIGGRRAQALLAEAGGVGARQLGSCLDAASGEGTFSSTDFDRAFASAVAARDRLAQLAADVIEAIDVEDCGTVTRDELTASLVDAEIARLLTEAGIRSRFVAAAADALGYAHDADLDVQAWAAAFREANEAQHDLNQLTRRIFKSVQQDDDGDDGGHVSKVDLAAAIADPFVVDLVKASDHFGILLREGEYAAKLLLLKADVTLDQFQAALELTPQGPAPPMPRIPTPVFPEEATTLPASSEDPPTNDDAGAATGADDDAEAHPQQPDSTSPTTADDDDDDDDDEPVPTNGVAPEEPLEEEEEEQKEEPPAPSPAEEVLEPPAEEPTTPAPAHDNDDDDQVEIQTAAPAPAPDVVAEPPAAAAGIVGDEEEAPPIDAAANAAPIAPKSPVAAPAPAPEEITFSPPPEEAAVEEVPTPAPAVGGSFSDDDDDDAEPTIEEAAVPEPAPSMLFEEPSPTAVEAPAPKPAAAAPEEPTVASEEEEEKEEEVLASVPAEVPADDDVDEVPADDDLDADRTTAADLAALIAADLREALCKDDEPPAEPEVVVVAAAVEGPNMTAPEPEPHEAPPASMSPEPEEEEEEEEAPEAKAPEEEQPTPKPTPEPVKKKAAEAPRNKVPPPKKEPPKGDAPPVVIKAVEPAAPVVEATPEATPPVKETKNLAEVEPARRSRMPATDATLLELKELEAERRRKKAPKKLHAPPPEEEKKDPPPSSSPPRDPQPGGRRKKRQQQQPPRQVYQQQQPSRASAERRRRATAVARAAMQLCRVLIRHLPDDLTRARKALDCWRDAAHAIGAAAEEKKKRKRRQRRVKKEDPWEDWSPRTSYLKEEEASVTVDSSRTGDEILKDVVSKRIRRRDAKRKARLSQQRRGGDDDDDGLAAGPDVDEAWGSARQQQPHKGAFPKFDLGITPNRDYFDDVEYDDDEDDEALDDAAAAAKWRELERMKMQRRSVRASQGGDAAANNMSERTTTTPAPSPKKTTTSSTTTKEESPSNKRKQQLAPSLDKSKFIHQPPPMRPAVAVRGFTFERPLELWLPFNGLPAPAVLHEHETLELRRVVGDGRLLVHAHSDRGEPLVVGAPLVDTASCLEPRSTRSSPTLDLKRTFPPREATLISFSSEPTVPVDWHRLGLLQDDDDDEEDHFDGDGAGAGGLRCEFVIIARFEAEDRVPIVGPPSRASPPKPRGYDEHPVRRVFGNLRATDREKGDNTINQHPQDRQPLPQITYNPGVPRRRYQPKHPSATIMPALPAATSAALTRQNHHQHDPSQQQRRRRQQQQQQRTPPHHQHHQHHYQRGGKATRTAQQPNNEGSFEPLDDDDKRHHRRPPPQRHHLDYDEVPRTDPSPPPGTPPPTKLPMLPRSPIVVQRPTPHFPRGLAPQGGSNSCDDAHAARSSSPGARYTRRYLSEPRQPPGVAGNKPIFGNASRRPVYAGQRD